MVCTWTSLQYEMNILLSSPDAGTRGWWQRKLEPALSGCSQGALTHGRSVHWPRPSDDRGLVSGHVLEMSASAETIIIMLWPCVPPGAGQRPGICVRPESVTPGWPGQVTVNISWGLERVSCGLHTSDMSHLVWDSVTVWYQITRIQAVSTLPLTIFVNVFTVWVMLWWWKTRQGLCLEHDKLANFVCDLRKWQSYPNLQVLILVFRASAPGSRYHIGSSVVIQHPALNCRSNFCHSDWRASGKL